MEGRHCRRVLGHGGYTRKRTAPKGDLQRAVMSNHAIGSSERRDSQEVANLPPPPPPPSASYTIMYDANETRTNIPPRTAQCGSLG